MQYQNLRGARYLLNSIFSHSAQVVGAVEYANCISVKGKVPTQRKF